MAPWAEIGQKDLKTFVLGVAETKRGSVVDLQGHMRSQAQFWILGQRPILDPQSQLHVSCFQKTAVSGSDQLKAWCVTAQGHLKLLNSSRRADFLKST